MLGHIKPITQYEQFKRLYKFFEEPPYEEKFSPYEVMQIYDDLCATGHIDGYFIDGECVGLIGFQKMKPGEHPVHYENPEKVAYFAEFMVDPKHRRNGIGSVLVEHMLECLKAEGYERVYMRTLNPNESKSYGIAVKHGFRQLPNVEQQVYVERVNKEHSSTEMRIFLDRDL